MKNEIINVDGKTIGNSGEEKAPYIVSAWCEANQLVLAQGGQFSPLAANIYLNEVDWVF
jgi:hypothetical protein